jgi:hypothetical protein
LGKQGEAVRGARQNGFWEIILKALRAAAFLISHTVLAMLVILGIYGVERLMAYLWGQRYPLLLGMIPLRYFFDAIDIGVLVIFGVRGMIAAYRAFEA